MSNDQRVLLCPICKDPRGLEKNLIISKDPRDLRCTTCDKTWASHYLEAFWDGYAQHIEDSRPIVAELQRVSMEWVSANRIIWAAAKCQSKGRLEIPDAIMQESEDPLDYFDAHYDPEIMATVITAKVRDPETDPTMH